MNFKDIPEFPGYSVTDTGTINSARQGKVRTLRPRLAPTGYMRIGLMRDGRQHWRFVHRLIWQAHVGPIPDGLVINHKNGVKNDNRLENLEVVTISANTAHSFSVLKNPPNRNPSHGIRNGWAKLDDETVMAIRAAYREPSATCRSVGDAFGINPTTVSRLVTGKAWRHL